MPLENTSFSVLKAKCIELGLCEYGSRNHLIYRLQAYHRTHPTSSPKTISRVPSFVIQQEAHGGNAHFLQLSPRRKEDYVKTKWCLPKSKVVNKRHIWLPRQSKKMLEGRGREHEGLHKKELENTTTDNEEDEDSGVDIGDRIKKPAGRQDEAPLQFKNEPLPISHPQTPRPPRILFALTPQEMGVEKSKLPITRYSMPGSWVNTPKKPTLELDEQTSKKYFSKINENGKRTYGDSTPQRVAKKPTIALDDNSPGEQLRTEFSVAAHNKLLKQRVVQMEYECAFENVQTAMRKKEQTEVLALREKLSLELDKKLQPFRLSRDKRLLEIQEDDEMPEREKRQKENQVNYRYSEMTMDYHEDAKELEDREIVKLLENWEEEARLKMIPFLKIRNDKLRLVEEGKL